jgi:hypothetical protein
LSLHDLQGVFKLPDTIAHLNDFGMKLLSIGKDEP